MAIEWLGVVLVVGLLAFVLVSAAPGLGSRIACGIEEQVAKLTGGDGSCGDDGRPRRAQGDRPRRTPFGAPDRPRTTRPTGAATRRGTRRPGGRSQRTADPFGPQPGSLQLALAANGKPNCTIYGSFVRCTPGTPKPRPRPRPKPTPNPRTTRVASGRLEGTGGNWVVFARDGAGRATRARATVTAQSVRQRTRRTSEGKASVSVEGASRRCGTDRGHLIGRILGGPGGVVENFVPLPLGFNRGPMATFEKKVARAARAGYVLKVDTIVSYADRTNPVPSRVKIVVKSVSAPPGAKPFNPVFDEAVPPRTGPRPKGCFW